MAEKVVQEKSKKFAVRIIKLYKYLCNEHKEYVLSKQILRSGTSIGANIAESQSAMSKKRFCFENIYCTERMYRNAVLVRFTI